MGIVYLRESHPPAAAGAFRTQPAVILSTGHSLTEYLAGSARKNPDLHYATFDGVFEAGDGMPGNMMNVLFQSEEPSYLAGYLAGMMTKTNTVGFIGGMDISAVDRFYYGYRAGIEAAAAERGQYILVERAVVGNFYNRDTAEFLADGMYDAGADVILQAAGDGGTRRDCSGEGERGVCDRCGYRSACTCAGECSDECYEKSGGGGVSDDR